MRSHPFHLLAACLLLLFTAAACKAPSGPAPERGPVDLQGAGATFPYPLYSRWIAEYGRIDPNVRINYQ